MKLKYILQIFCNVQSIEARLGLIQQSLINVENTQENIMATIQEISTKVDELQVQLDAEQQAIADAIAALQTQVTALQGMIVDGGTTAERQAVMDKLNVVITDLQGTIA